MDYKSIARSLRQLNTEPNAANMSMIDADGAAADRVASAAIDDSSLVAPWFVPASTPAVSAKGMHRNLEVPPHPPHPPPPLRPVGIMICSRTRNSLPSEVRLNQLRAGGRGGSPGTHLHLPVSFASPSSSSLALRSLMICVGEVDCAPCGSVEVQRDYATAHCKTPSPAQPGWLSGEDGRHSMEQR